MLLGPSSERTSHRSPALTPRASQDAAITAITPMRATGKVPGQEEISKFPPNGTGFNAIIELFA